MRDTVDGHVTYWSRLIAQWKHGTREGFKIRNDVDFSHLGPNASETKREKENDIDVTRRKRMREGGRVFILSILPRNTSETRL